MRVYLLLADAAYWVGDVSHRVWLWALLRASARTEHGEGAKRGEEPPW